MEFTISQEVLDVVLGELKTIDEKMTASAGTISERRKTAEAALQSKVSLDKAGSPWARIAQAQAEIARLTDELADAKNAAREAVDGYLRTQKDESSAELDSLRSAREALVVKAKAIGALLGKEIDVPKAPKGSASSTSGSHVQTAKGTFSYRRSDSDDWTVPNPHQQSLSSIAFRVFGEASVRDLRTALDVDETKSYEKTVTVNGKDGKPRTATVRFSVTPVAAE